MLIGQFNIILRLQDLSRKLDECGSMIFLVMLKTVIQTLQTVHGSFENAFRTDPCFIKRLHDRFEGYPVPKIMLPKKCTNLKVWKNGSVDRKVGSTVIGWVGPSNSELNL